MNIIGNYKIKKNLIKKKKSKRRENLFKTKMSSALDIQIVSESNLEKIQNFLNDSTYRETIEYSANFNSRLCVERRMRVPFFDPQTGVAQNHCSLFMDRRMRMPGFREGQIYSYPSARWRKSRRQYLTKRPFGNGVLRRGETNIGNNSSSSIGIVGLNATGDDSDFNGTLLEESSSLGGADTSDSKDSQNLKEDLPKEWFYDDIDMNNMDDLDEPKSPDDEYDYDPRYGNKKRKKRRPGRKPTPIHHHIHDGPRKGRPPGGGGSGGLSIGLGRGRGRRKNLARNLTNEMPSSPTSEPPSFESVAAAVECASNDNDNSNGGTGSDLRNYRKYL